MSVVVADLIASAVVEEAGDLQSSDVPSPARTGRPPVLVGLTRTSGLAVGIDLGKRHARVLVSDLSHRVLARRVAETSDQRSAEQHIKQLSSLVTRALTDAGADRREVVAAGMGLPGPVRQDTGQVGDTAILPGWVGVEAATAMERALGFPVVVANDANLGALGEWTWGAAQGVDDLVYIKAATGIGAGMILGGAPYGGSGGMAGEFGHLQLDPTGRRCLCGNRGCLETIAGVEAITELIPREESGTRPTITRALALAHEGDMAAVQAFERAGHAIGTAAAMLCNLLNPALIVLGGSLAAAGPLLLDPMTEALRSAAIGATAGDVTVVPGALGVDAEVRGALALALRSAVPEPR